MQRRDYTPTKSHNVLTNLTNTQATNKNNIQYTGRTIANYDTSYLREYQTIKAQIRQLQSQNRQLSSEAERLRYQKSVQQNRYLQKITHEQDSINQFHKQTKYQLQLLKIKQQQDTNKARRQFQGKLDQLLRQSKRQDYKNRQLTQNISYLQIRGNQLKKGVETLEIQLMKCRQNNTKITQLLSNQKLTQNKLIKLTQQLQKQKIQMENQIHVLLDIESQKSRTVNTLQVTLRNSQNNEASLHDKLSVLTQNFVNLQDHIAIMKDRLLSTQHRNQQLEAQLQQTQVLLRDKEKAVYEQKERQQKLRRQLETQQHRQQRRQKQYQQATVQTQRLYKQIQINQQQLHQLCIKQGIDI